MSASRENLMKALHQCSNLKASCRGCSFYRKDGSKCISHLLTTARETLLTDADALAASEKARSELGERLALSQAQLQEARAERELMYMSLAEKMDCDDCIRANDLVACEDADWNCDVCKDRQTCRCCGCGLQTHWKNWTWKGEKGGGE